MIQTRNLKRIQASLLTLLFTLGLLFACNINFSAAAATRYTGVTTTDINIRSSPSSKSKKIGTVKKGSTVSLIGSIKKGETVNGYTADMHFFQLTSGGYIAQQYVANVKVEKTNTSTGESSVSDVPEISDPPENTDTPSAGNDDSNEAEDIVEDISDTELNDDEVQVEDPSTDESIPLDDEIIDESSEVTTDEPKTDTESESGSNSSALPANSNPLRMITSTGSLNVRSEPTTSATVLRKLSSGKSVYVTTLLKSGAKYKNITVKGDWYALSDGGFVSADYLKRASTSTVSTTTSTKESSKKSTTATAKSNTTYYANPSTLAFTRGTMSKGTTRTVSATYKDGSTFNGNKVIGTWYKLSNGYFVRSSDVSIGSKSVPTTVSVKVTKTNLSSGDSVQAKTAVNVRSGPGTGYSKVKTMQSGTRDTVVSVAQNGSKYNNKTVSNGWVKLKSMNGWVQADYLKYAEGSVNIISP